jgi:hypothetical protein
MLGFYPSIRFDRAREGSTHRESSTGAGKKQLPTRSRDRRAIDILPDVATAVVAASWEGEPCIDPLFGPLGIA